MNVRPAKDADAAEIAFIFNHYVATSHSTFVTEPADTPLILEKIADSTAAGHPFLVCDDDGDVLGYAYARKFRQGAAYDRTLELSVYVRPGAHEHGIGARLYAAMMDQLRADGVHSAVAVIALPNDASVGLHEKFGFRRVGTIREAGAKFGRWFDVGIWQYVLSDESLPN